MCTRTDHDGACEDCQAGDAFVTYDPSTTATHEPPMTDHRTEAERLLADSVRHTDTGDIRDAYIATARSGQSSASALLAIHDLLNERLTPNPGGRAGDLSDDRAEQAPTEEDDPCICAACQPDYRLMRACGTCGYKRCPGAADHRNTCTGSNEPGQPGSLYADPPPPQETPMPTITRTITVRLDPELVALLTEIRDRLPKPREVRVDLAARNLDAIKHELETPMREHGECCEPVGVTQDQPIVKRIVDRDGDVWERREEGWSLWHSSEWGPWRGHGRWPQPPGNGILRPATPADLARVGIEDEHAPQADPDTVTLRRDHVEAMLKLWVRHSAHPNADAVTRSTRAALGWGDSDDA